MNISDKILQLTEGGKRVFEYYFGTSIDERKNFYSPLRKENNASCSWHRTKAGCQNGKLVFSDFGTEHKDRDCFWFVAWQGGYENGNYFLRAAREIDQMLGLGVFHEKADRRSEKKPVRGSVNYKEGKSNGTTNGRKRTVTGWKAHYREMKPTEKAYWAKYGIGKDILDRYNVKALSMLHLWYDDGSESKFFSYKDNPQFGYVFNNGEGVRLYRPFAKNHSNRFFNYGKVPHPYVFGLEQLPGKGDRVYLTGGEKDALTMAAHGFNALTFGSESEKFQVPVLDELSRRFHDIIIMFDTDGPGIENSINRYNEYKDDYNIHRLQLPLKCKEKKLDKENTIKLNKDISDFFMNGHTSEELVSLTDSVIAADEREKSEKVQTKPKIEHFSL